MDFLTLIQHDLCHPPSVALFKTQQWTCTTCFETEPILPTWECHSVVWMDHCWQCTECGRKSDPPKTTLRCHESILLNEVPQLICTQCQRNAFRSGTSLYSYILQDFDDHFRSSLLAQAFQEWSGDENVPVSFPLSDVRGLYPKRIRGQKLSCVRETVRLLRAVNAPFTTEGGAAACPEMETFLAHYMDVLSKQPSSHSSVEEKVLQTLIDSMRQLIQCKEFSNPFQLYFHKLVPLIQYCARHEDWQPLPALPENPNLALELYTQLVRSNHIRNTFGQYSIPFDVIHVMLGCYVCSCDSGAVANWILDLIARISRGEYFWKRYAEKQPSVKAMQHLLTSNISYNKNTPFYHVVRAIRNGESAETLSANWTTYLQLQAFVGNHFKMSDVGNPDVLELISGQLFPSILFEDHCDQLGFNMQLGHLMSGMCMKTGQIKKGSFKTARRIHDVIRRIMKRVQEFDGIQNLWTIDTLHQFLVSKENDNLVQEMRELCQVLCTRDKSK